MAETDTTQRFIAALQTLEATRDLDPITRLYAPESEIGNIVSPHARSGPEGARAFWQAYRDSFGDIASTFRNVIVHDGRAALEWTTTGTAANGAPIAYAGVSILELEGDQIRRFFAYFDPSDLGRQIEGTAS